MSGGDGDTGHVVAFLVVDPEGRGDCDDFCWPGGLGGALATTEFGCRNPFVQRPPRTSVYDVCMARLNVYVPDELAQRAKSAEVNVSALVQAALADELDRQATDEWLATVPIRTSGAVVSSADVVDAVHAARDEFGEA